MNDGDFVEALQAVFDANDPADGIDRHDGYGIDHRIESARVVPSDDGFDDLEVTVRLGTETVTSRLLFDRAWREASGLDDVGAYAVFAAGRWRFSQVEVLPVPEVADGRDRERWKGLIASLAGSATSVAASRLGLIEVVDDQGDLVSIHVRPEEWSRFSAGREEQARRVLADLIGSRWDDEEHIVFFRGAFHHSVREQLPPVRSKLSF